MMKKLIPFFLLIVITTSHNASAQQAGTPEIDIFRAIQAGNLDQLQAIVRQDTSRLNTRDRHKETPLHHAAASGNVELTQFLIDSGADIYAVDFRNQTPLHAAAKGGYTKIIKLFLDAGVPVDLRDGYEDTTLHLACRSRAPHSHTAVVLLIQHGADPTAYNSSLNQPLLLACGSNDRERVEFLLKTGAHGAVNSRNVMDHTPLLHAIWNNSLDIIKLLLEHDADIETTGFKAGPLLEHAVHRRNPTIVEYLINYKSDITPEDVATLDRMMPGWREKKHAFERAQREFLVQELCLPKDIAHLVMTFTKKLEPQAP